MKSLDPKDVNRFIRESNQSVIMIADSILNELERKTAFGVKHRAETRDFICMMIESMATKVHMAQMSEERGVKYDFENVMLNAVLVHQKILNAMNDHPIPEADEVVKLGEDYMNKKASEFNLLVTRVLEAVEDIENLI